MAAHRYWQLNITANNGGSGGIVVINHLVMAEQVLGPTVLLGSTVSTSSNFSGSYTGANAIDVDRTTRWNSGSSPTPHTIAFDLGSGNSKDVQEVRLTGDAGFPTYSPKDFKLQYSDDNATWFDQITVTGASVGTPPYPVVYRTGSCPDTLTGYLFYRFSSTASDGGSAFAQAEFELRLTVGGSDITSTTDCWASASSSFGGQPPSLAIDNNPATWWSANGATTASWLVELPYKQPIAQVALTALSGGNQIYSSTTGNLAGSQDASSFTTLLSWSGQTGWSAGQTRTFTAAAASTWKPRIIIC